MTAERNVTVQVRARFAGQQAFKEMAAAGKEAATATENAMERAARSSARAMSGIGSAIADNARRGREEALRQIQGLDKAFNDIGLRKAGKNRLEEFLGISKADKAMERFTGRLRMQLEGIERKALTLKVDGDPRPLLARLQGVQRQAMQAQQLVQQQSRAAFAGLSRAGGGSWDVAAGLSVLSVGNQGMEAMVQKLLGFNAAMQVARGAKDILVGTIGGAANFARLDRALLSARAMGKEVTASTAAVRAALMGQAGAENVAAVGAGRLAVAENAVVASNARLAASNNAVAASEERAALASNEAALGMGRQTIAANGAAAANARLGIGGVIPGVGIGLRGLLLRAGLGAGIGGLVGGVVSGGDAIDTATGAGLGAMLLPMLRGRAAWAAGGGALGLAAGHAISGGSVTGTFLGGAIGMGGTVAVQAGGGALLKGGLGAFGGALGGAGVAGLVAALAVPAAMLIGVVGTSSTVQNLIAHYTSAAVRASDAAVERAQARATANHQRLLRGQLSEPEEQAAQARIEAARPFEDRIGGLRDRMTDLGISGGEWAPFGFRFPVTVDRTAERLEMRRQLYNRQIGLQDERIADRRFALDVPGGQTAGNYRALAMAEAARRQMGLSRINELRNGLLPDQIRNNRSLAAARQEAADLDRRIGPQQALREFNAREEAIRGRIAAYRYSDGRGTERAFRNLEEFVETAEGRHGFMRTPGGRVTMEPVRIANEFHALRRQRDAVQARMGSDAELNALLSRREQIASRLQELEERGLQLDTQRRQQVVAMLDVERQRAREDEQFWRNRAAQLRAQGRSEAAQFGFLHPSLQQAALEVAQRQSRGGRLDYFDLQIARQVGAPLQRYVDAEGRRLAREFGYHDRLRNTPVLDEGRLEMGPGQQEQEAGRLAEENRQISVSVAASIPTEIRLNEEAIMRQLQERVAPAILNAIAKLENRMADAIRRAMDARQSNEQAGTGH
jgi:hypothetical protein